MTLIAFPPVTPDADLDTGTLRREVREFLRDTLGPDYGPSLQARSWNGHDPDFSQKLGARGWLGMTWPRAYGGHDRQALERYVVVEELLAAGAPVAAHWIADRQSAPLVLAHGTEAQRQDILPRVAAGSCYFCIGMSEPDSGSDLAAARTQARRTDDGYVVNGTKLWTTYAHKAHYMILLCRTGTAEDRHGGLSQFLVDLTTPGISIRPVLDIAGEHHMNEVSFQDVLLPHDALLGKEGQGWDQVMGELAFERSGPDRFLSSFALINALIAQIGAHPDRAEAEAVGRIAAHLMVLRRMSVSVAGMLSRRENPTLQAAIVKDLGALLEQEIPELARSLIDTAPRPGERDSFAAVLAQTILSAPSFSLRGGTRQILRGIIARGLGLR